MSDPAAHTRAGHTPPAQPRAAIYNRYWHTRGGGERHSGMIAQCLTRRGVAVDLIAHAAVDVDDLASHLGLDLSECQVKIVPDANDESLARYTTGYDLFINGSHMSRIRPEAKRSAYLCYFPTPPDHDLSPGRKRLARVLRPVLESQFGSEIAYGTGWHWPEAHRLRSWRWTDGEGELVIEPGPTRTLHFDAGRLGLGERRLTVKTSDGRPLLTADVTDRFKARTVQVPPCDELLTLFFTSEPDVGIGKDKRDLGIALSRFRFHARIGLRHRVAERLRWIQNVDADQSHLDGYDVILANSLYTLGWIERFWDRDAEILYPPINVDGFTAAPEREKTIVSVGRFFAPSLGHSKRQLEQVQTFGRMHRDGKLPGWTLHLVGGCEKIHEDYLHEVRDAAAGLPVELHVNAPRQELEDIVSHAAVQWSATGYDVDEEAEPWATEHFGITTVEAMAAGCVPVVIDRAGQREIVRHGVDGFRWQTLDELAARTIEVAEDDQLRARMAESSVEAARVYSEEAFSKRLDELIDRFGLLP